MLVPAGTEGLLLGLGLGVWVQLRRLRVGGVYQLTAAALVLDAMSQAWQLRLRLGQPAGVTWLLHVAVCAVMLYVLHRLGHLLARMRQGPGTECVLVEEGG